MPKKRIIFLSLFFFISVVVLSFTLNVYFSHNKTVMKMNSPVEYIVEENEGYWNDLFQE